MLKFRCAQCNQKIGVPEEYAGKRVRCPRCKSAAKVPQASEIAPAIQQTAAAPPAVILKETTSEAVAGPAPGSQEPIAPTAHAPATPEPVREAPPGALESVVTAHAPPGFASVFAEHLPPRADQPAASMEDLGDDRVADEAYPAVASQSDPGQTDPLNLSQTIEDPAPKTANVIDAPTRRTSAPRSSEDEVNELLRDLRDGEAPAGDSALIFALQRPDEFDVPSPEGTQVRQEDDSHGAKKRQVTTHVAPSGRLAALLGVGGIALGVAAIALCWVTGAARFALPVSAAGLVLALAGVGLAAARNGPGIGLCSIGTIVAALGIAVPVLGAYGMMPLPGRVHLPVAGSTAVINVSMPAGDASAIQAEQRVPADGFVPATSPLVLGDVQVRVSSARVVQPAVHDGHWNSLRSLPDKRLLISLELRNLASGGHATYRTWARNAPGEEPASLTDGAGNSLKAIDLAPLVPVGRVSEDPARLYPGRSATPDVLIFEMPVSTSQDLKLQLPGANIGASGTTLRIRIPAPMVQY